MKFTVSAFTYFGSGSAGARLIIDGRLIRPTRYERDGFVCWGVVDVPAEEIRRAAEIRYTREAFPGRRVELVGSGRQFLRWLNPVRGHDRLSDPGVIASRYAAAKRLREFRQAEAARVAPPVIRRHAKFGHTVRAR